MTHSSFLHRLSTSVAKVGQFWHESINGSIFRWNLFIVLLQLAVAWYKYNDLPPEIPLFYSLPWGSLQLAVNYWVFIIPVIAFLIILINNFLAVFLLQSHLLLSRLLIITSLLFSIFSLIAIFQSISLVL